VNDDMADAVIRSIADEEHPVVMLHDYHLYTCPGLIRKARPDAFLHYFVHIPWSQPDSWRILPKPVARGDLPEHAGQRHHRVPHDRPYCRNFLQCCRELMELEVDFERGAVIMGDERPGSAPIRSRSTPSRLYPRRGVRAGARVTSASCSAAGATT